jgi:predicted outer membrane repeat protein
VGTLTLTKQSRLRDNTATDHAGGLDNGGTTVVEQGSVTGNRALNVRGGGLFNYVGATLTVKASNISGNNAPTGGGIDNFAGATATVQDSTVSGNSASFGAGIFNAGALELFKTTVTGNSASVTGGGALNTGTISLIGSLVTRNTPDDCSGC